MSLNKQQLEAVNQANFPDNNSKYITPQLLREFNTDMIDAIQLTGSYATTGSNNFVGNQTITGDLNVSGVISASVLHVQYETASVIYSSGSNQLGDELTDVQTLSGSVKIQGQLLINGVPLSSGSATIDTGSLVTTASFNQYTQSANNRLNSLETNSASVNVSINNLNQTTASLNTSITNLNQFTQSQQALNGTFATTGSNTFTGNQIIDRANKLYTNGIYWTDVTAGFNNLEIINQGGGNLDFASLNGGKMRVVNTPLILTGSALSSSNDISTSGNIYAANLTGSSANLTSLNQFTASQQLLNGTFATTGSNIFVGQQNIQSLLYIEEPGNPLIYTQFIQDPLTNTLQINQAGSNKVQFNSSDLNIIGTLTASIQQGYVWVGDSTGRTITVATSSFAGGGTINTGSFATTGSNIFYGDQIISGSSSMSYGLDVTNGIKADYFYTDGQGVFTPTLYGATVGLGKLQIEALGGVNINGHFTASLEEGYVWVGDSLNKTKLVATSSFFTSGSGPTDISALNAFTASQLTINAGYNTFTQSTNTSINSLNAATSSYVTETESGSFLLTASFDNNTRNLTFTKGNNTTFNVNIPDVSGSTLPAGVISGSAQITELGFVSSSITASSLITASAAGATITFTKGDNTQFSVTVATGSFVSASYAETASLATNALDIIVNAKNTTGVQLNKGTVVRIIGATGDNPLIGTASWTDDDNSANTLGFVTENIPNDSFGRVITQGTLLGINTDPVLGYTAGQLVYLSGSGQYTNVKPPAPYHEVRLGQVMRAQQNNGSIYVLIQNGYELSELHDVDINTGSLANNNLLAYNSATLQWENKTLTEVGATTTASFNQYTSSTNSRLNNIETTTASLLIETQNLELFSASALSSISQLNQSSASQQVSINALNVFTASQSTASIVTSITNLNGFTSSANIRLNNLETTTASLNSSISQLNASSASQQISINNLNTTTASLLIETQNLELFSASALSSISQLNASSASQQVSINALNAATSSYVTETESGSFLITASFSGNTLTFTKGNNTTFGVVIPDVSGSTINTGSFATTGSNAFRGTNSFSGAVSFTGSAPTILSQSFSGSLITNLTDIYTDIPAVQQIVTLTSASYAALASGSLTNPNTLYIVSGSISGSGGGGTTDISSLNAFTASQFVSNSFFATTGSNVFTGQQTINANNAITISGSNGFGYGITLQGAQGIKLEGSGGPRIQFPNEMWMNGNQNENFEFTGDTNNPLTRGLQFRIYGSGSRAMNFLNESGPSATMQFTNTSGSMTFTAGGTTSITASTLQLQGFTFPTTDGTNGQVLTTNGSKVLSFTTVGGTINTGSFATTGSNTFTGQQTINLSGTAQNGAISIIGNSTQVETDMYVDGGNYDTFNVFISASNGIQLRDYDVTNNVASPFISVATDAGNLRLHRNTTISGSLSVSGSINGNNTFVGNQIISGAVMITGSFGPPFGYGLIVEKNVRINQTISTKGFNLSGSDATEAINSLYQNTLWQHAGNVTFSNQIGGVGSGSITISALGGGNLNLSGSTTNIAGVNFIPFSASVNSRINAINTSSFATTGSNTFIGNQIISGTFVQSGSNSLSGGPNGATVGTWIQNRVNISGGDGGVSGVTPRLFISGSDGAYSEYGRGFQTLDTSRVPQLGASIYTGANIGNGASNTVAVYTADTYVDDVEIQMFANSSSIGLADWDNGTTFSYVPFMSLAPNLGNNPPVEFKRDVQVTGSVSITDIIKLKAQNPLPTGNIGDLAVSGSHLYFYNGAWTQLD